MGTIVVAGWFVLLPDEYANIGKHIFGGTLFLSNFVLWSETGYFDVAARAKPLLHLWSLGIEEQYYIFFPIFLWFCAKKNIQAAFGIIVLFFISFFDNIYLHRVSPVIDFYSPLSRIWELLLGASLAASFRHNAVQVAYLKLDALCSGFVFVASQKNDGRSLSVILAVVGSVLLGMGLLLAREGDPYPGWTALLPTMGAGFLIAAGPLNPISKYVLSNRLSVFIGKISYPLYLWHWGLISFAFIVVGSLDSSTKVLRILLVVISFVLSILTYFFVEKKVRYYNSAKFSIPFILIITMLCISFCGIIIKYNNGFPSRVNYKEAEYINDINAKIDIARKICLEIYPDWKKLNDNICMTQNAMDKITIAAIGDSHAGHLFPGLIDAVDSKNFVAVFPASGAAPYIDIASFTRAGLDFRKNGTFLINRSYDAILKNSNIKYVILAHNPECSYSDIIDKRDESLVDRDVILKNGMRRTFKKLINAGKKVIVVLDNPRLPFDISSCVDRPLKVFSQNNECKFEKKTFDNDAAANWYKKILLEVLKDYPSVVVIDLKNIFCDNNFCYGKKDGKILYRDTNHLSINGSLLVAKEIFSLISSNNILKDK